MLRKLGKLLIKKTVDKVLDPWYERNYGRVRSDYSLSNEVARQLEYALGSTSWSICGHEDHPDTEVIIKQVKPVQTDDGDVGFMVSFVEDDAYSDTAEEHCLLISVFLQTFTPEGDVVGRGNDA